MPTTFSRFGRLISVRLIIAICWSRFGSTVRPDISGLSTDCVST